MSEATKAALEEAVAAHFSDEEEGGMLTGFVVSMSGITPESSSEEKTIYGQDSMTGQPFHSTLGLLNIAVMNAEDYWSEDAS